MGAGGVAYDREQVMVFREAARLPATRRATLEADCMADGVEDLLEDATVDSEAGGIFLG